MTDTKRAQHNRIKFKCCAVCSWCHSVRPLRLPTHWRVQKTHFALTESSLFTAFCVLHPFWFSCSQWEICLRLWFPLIFVNQSAELKRTKFKFFSLDIFTWQIQVIQAKFCSVVQTTFSSVKEGIRKWMNRQAQLHKVQSCDSTLVRCTFFLLQCNNSSELWL